MSQIDSTKDYYDVLGVSLDATRDEIDRQYKREAHKHHPDRGGSEEGMKSLNEAYWVLKDETMRRDYDLKRRKPAPVIRNRASAPAAQDIGLFGHFLSAFLCLLLGLFLLMLVRFQWIWFLWPLVILALFVILFGVLMTHSAMIAVSESLPARHPVRRYRKAQEAMFWLAVVVAGYGVYLLLTNVG